MPQMAAHPVKCFSRNAFAAHQYEISFPPHPESELVVFVLEGSFEITYRFDISEFTDLDPSEAFQVNQILIGPG